LAARVDNVVDTVVDNVVDTVVDNVVDTVVDNVVDTVVDNVVDTVVDSSVDTCKQDVDNSVDTCKQDVDKTRLINLLGLEDILAGDLYNAETLKRDGYFKAVADNKAKIAEISGIELKMTEDLADMNAIIKWLGCNSIRTTHNKISYRRVIGK
jgi:hypothetical protein